MSEEAFSNEPIAARSIPRASSVQFSPLDPAHAAQLMTEHGLALALATAAAVAGHVFGVAFLPALPLALILTAALGLAAMILVLDRLVAKYRGYSLRERDLLYRSGVIWRRVTAVPFNRIQHVETRRGPVERFYRLSSVQVFTAGAGKADITVPGLPADEAERLHAHLLERAGGGDDG